MLRKKQIIMIVSVAVISFLIGTTSNSMTMAEDDDRGNPYVWEAIHDLQDRVEILENTPLPEGLVSAPAYDSGWIQRKETITASHNLNTTEVVVYLIGKDADGSLSQTGLNSRWHSLANNDITLYSSEFDLTHLRVMIWKLQEPPA